jgi:hypothetical protein
MGPASTKADSESFPIDNTYASEELDLPRK